MKNKVSDNQEIYRPKKYKPIEYVNHMITCCEETSFFRKNYDEKKFLKLKENSMMNEAIYAGSLHYIQQIGWCAYNLPKDTFYMFPQNDLRRIIAAGYFLEHSPIFGMDPRVVWSIIHTTIPNLFPVLKKIKHII